MSTRQFQRMWFGRFLVSILVIAVLAAAVGGCGGTKPAEEGKPSGTPENKPGAQAKREVILATTTSTVDTRLLDVLLPLFESKTGYKVKPLSLGSGQAMAMGERGEADALLVHVPKDEQKLVQSGVVVNRQLVMHNDFIIVGPPNDPAKIKGVKSAADAFRAISQEKATFVSRADDSGTHKKEKQIWSSTGIKPSGSWYMESGVGMGETLNIASEKSGYTLTDRGTYLARKSTLRLVPVVEGDPVLLNVYHVMQVNPAKFEKVNAEGAKALVEFMVSKEAQEIIRTYGVDKYGEPLFFPDAGKPEPVPEA